MDSGTGKLKLRVPQQDLQALSMCGHTPKKLEAWGRLTHRSFSRSQHQCSIDVSLGLSGTHYFGSLLNRASAIDFTSNTIEEDEVPPFESFNCKVTNTSPGGFCVVWAGLVPNQVKTGELITVSEDHQTAWSIGVIRWVKQFTNEGARMGLKLLAPSAIPVGVKIISKTGKKKGPPKAQIDPEDDFDSIWSGL